MTVARTYLLHPAKHGHLIGLLQEIERSSMPSTLISKKEKKMVRREEGRETSKWKAAKTAPTPSLRAQTHEPPLTLKKLKTDIFGERKEGGNGQREYGGESQLFLLCHHRHHHHRSHSPTGRLLSLPPPFPPPLLFLFLFFPCSDSGWPTPAAALSVPFPARHPATSCSPSAVWGRDLCRRILRRRRWSVSSLCRWSPRAVILGWSQREWDRWLRLWKRGMKSALTFIWTKKAFFFCHPEGKIIWSEWVSKSFEITTLYPLKISLSCRISIGKRGCRCKPLILTSFCYLNSMLSVNQISCENEVFLGLNLELCSVGLSEKCGMRYEDLESYFLIFHNLTGLIKVRPLKWAYDYEQFSF